MDMHPALMTEIIRQRQVELMDDAKRSPRALRTRRGKHRHAHE